MTDKQKEQQLSISNLNTDLDIGKTNWIQASFFDAFGINNSDISSVKTRLDKLEKSVSLFNDFLVHKGIAIENEFRDFVVSRELLDKITEIAKTKEEILNIDVNVKMPSPAQYIHIDFQFPDEEKDKEGL